MALPSKMTSQLFKVWRNDGWKKSLFQLSFFWLALLVLFGRDTSDIVLIWWNSSSFNHCLLLLPILGWLVWQRKDQLSELTPSFWALPLLWFAAGAGGWLLGEAAGVAVARQAGLIMMLQGSAAALLGPQVTRGILFPLFFMFFLLPVGEEIVPFLQTLTAKMCMALLALVGIPAYIDGIFITTPNGYFRVAEACSGIEFLLAMIALGGLVSNLCFNSWKRRAIFMALCVIVPVVTNGLRAFGTIYIAEKTGIEFAASWDHVFYGWIFFAIVVTIVLGIGWQFFDRSADAIAFDPKAIKDMPLPKVRGALVYAALAVMTLLPLLWSAFVMNMVGSLPNHISLPQVEGWEVAPYEPTKAWQPNFNGADHYLFGRYRNAQGQEIDLFAVAFDRQVEGKEIVGYGQGAITPEGNWSWVADIASPKNGKAERIKTAGPVVRDVISFYRINGVTSGSGMVMKLATLKAKLLAGDQRAVGIILSAEHSEGKSNRAAIDAFISDMGDIDKVADRMITVG